MSRLGKWIVGLVVALGFTGVALASPTDVEASTLYRAYNPNTGEHLYTQMATRSHSWFAQGGATKAQHGKHLVKEQEFIGCLTRITGEIIIHFEHERSKYVKRKRLAL
jgi:hypothetical protein